MNADEMNEMIGSFISGLGKKDNIDINNAIFIAKELLHLHFPIKYRGAGRNGVKSLELYMILRNVKVNQKNKEAFRIGNTLAEYSSSELILMASYLWNEGKSSLNSNERGEAIILLKNYEGKL